MTAAQRPASLRWIGPNVLCAAVTELSWIPISEIGLTRTGSLAGKPSQAAPGFAFKVQFRGVENLRHSSVPRLELVAAPVQITLRCVLFHGPHTSQRRRRAAPPPGLTFRAGVDVLPRADWTSQAQEVQRPHRCVVVPLNARARSCPRHPGSTSGPRARSTTTSCRGCVGRAPAAAPRLLDIGAHDRGIRLAGNAHGIPSVRDQPRAQGARASGVCVCASERARRARALVHRSRRTHSSSTSTASCGAETCGSACGRSSSRMIATLPAKACQTRHAKPQLVDLTRVFSAGAISFLFRATPRENLSDPLAPVLDIALPTFAVPVSAIGTRRRVGRAFSQVVAPLTEPSRTPLYASKATPSRLRLFEEKDSTKVGLALSHPSQPLCASGRGVHRPVRESGLADGDHAGCG